MSIESVSMGFTSLYLPVTVMDRNLLTSALLTPQMHVSFSDRSPYLLLAPEAAQRPRKAWKAIYFMLRTHWLLSAELLKRQEFLH